MASTRRPRDSQISWPVPISVATATKRLDRASMATPFSARVEHVAQPLAGDEAGAREVEIEEAQHLAARQLARELLQRGELAGHIAAAHHGADRGAGDDVGVDAGLVQRAQDADMRPAAGRAASERQTDLAITHCWAPERANSSLTPLADLKGRCLPQHRAVNHSAEELSEPYGRINGGLRRVPRGAGIVRPPRAGDDSTELKND